MTKLAVEEDITSLVKKIADRMRDPEAVKQIVTAPSNVNPNPIYKVPHWGNLSIADGYPGVLLLLAQLDLLFSDEKWDLAVHSYVLKIKESIESKGLDSGFSLFGGLAGTCLALRCASKGNTRYQKMLATLDTALIKGVKINFLYPLKENLSKACSSSPGLYDVIQGIAGIGMYALRNQENPELHMLLKEILQALVGLSKPLEIKGEVVPGWYFAQEHQFTEEDKNRFPDGSFNLGLAHGVPGILAILSLAASSDIIVDGQINAIESITNWLSSHREKSKGAFLWKHCISFQDEVLMIKEESIGTRDAWCYGTPGVANAIFLAGEALQREDIKQMAVESFCSIFQRSQNEWYLPGPTFCHGISGLLLLTHHLAKKTEDLRLIKQTEILKNMLLEFYNDSHTFGFKDYELSCDNHFFQNDRAGLLEGASGVLLVLLSVKGLSSWCNTIFLVDNEK